MMRADSAACWLRRLCLALPVLLLAANLLAWLRWGVDLPFLDDWRAYDERRALSLAPAHLFQAINNTIAPIGVFLDVLAQRWLGGNALPYQALTMLAVLGGLLGLQWRLLTWALRGHPWQVAVCFLPTVFMLQSGSYWGEQNLAYQQALPLVALLAAAWCNFAARRRPPWRAAWVALLGLLAGLAYVSGAVAALVMGAGWWLAGLLMRGRGAGGLGGLAARARTGGAALAAAGLLTTALQMVLTWRPGADPAGQHMRLTWPTEADFWLYAAAKLGRASGHGFAAVGAEVAWVALLALALAAAGLAAARYLRRAAAPARRAALLFLPLLAALLVYLALVSLGRASLRDAQVRDWEQVFRFGYLRFHFFWLTLLLPWAAAVGVAVARARRDRARAATPRQGAPRYAALALAVLAIAGARGVFGVAGFYRDAAAFRAGELRCLSRQLPQLGSGRPIVCPGFDVLGISDWGRAYRHARAIGASFVRYLPIVALEGQGQVLFDWDDPAQRAAVRWSHLHPQEDGWWQAEADPHFIIPVAPGSPAAGSCAVLGVQARLVLERPETVQLFYRAAGQAAYSEYVSIRQPVTPGAAGEVSLELLADSRPGFASEVRLDPIDGPGRFRLLGLRVACRMEP